MPKLVRRRHGGPPPPLLRLRPRKYLRSRPTFRKKRERISCRRRNPAHNMIVPVRPEERRAPRARSQRTNSQRTSQGGTSVRSRGAPLASETVLSPGSKRPTDRPAHRPAPLAHSPVRRGRACRPAVSPQDAPLAILLRRAGSRALREDLPPPRVLPDAHRGRDPPRPRPRWCRAGRATRP